MVLNDGDGLFDKYGMLQSCIDILNTVDVKGYENCKKILDIGQRLTAVKAGMKKEEDEQKQEEI